MWVFATFLFGLLARCQSQPVGVFDPLGDPMRAEGVITGLLGGSADSLAAPGPGPVFDSAPIGTVVDPALIGGPTGVGVGPEFGPTGTGMVPADGFPPMGSDTAPDISYLGFTLPDIERMREGSDRGLVYSTSGQPVIDQTAQPVISRQSIENEYRRLTATGTGFGPRSSGGEIGAGQVGDGQIGSGQAGSQSGGGTVTIEFTRPEVERMMRGMTNDKNRYNYRGVEVTADSTEPVLTMTQLEQLMAQFEPTAPVSTAEFTLEQVETMLEGTRNGMAYNYQGNPAVPGESTLNMMQLRELLAKLQPPASSLTAEFTLSQVQNMIDGMKLGSAYNYQGLKASPGEPVLSMEQLLELRSKAQPAATSTTFTLAQVQAMINGMNEGKAFNYQGVIASQGEPSLTMDQLRNLLAQLQPGVPSRTVRFTMEQIQTMIAGMQQGRFYNYQGNVALAGERRLSMEQLKQLESQLRPAEPTRTVRFTLEQIKSMIFGMNQGKLYNYQGNEATPGEGALTMDQLRQLESQLQSTETIRFTLDQIQTMISGMNQGRQYNYQGNIASAGDGVITMEQLRQLESQLLPKAPAKTAQFTLEQIQNMISEMNLGRLYNYQGNYASDGERTLTMDQLKQLESELQSSGRRMSAPFSLGKVQDMIIGMENRNFYNYDGMPAATGQRTLTMLQLVYLHRQLQSRPVDAQMSVGISDRPDFDLTRIREMLTGTTMGDMYNYAGQPARLDDPKLSMTQLELMQQEYEGFRNTGVSSNTRNQGFSVDGQGSTTSSGPGVTGPSSTNVEALMPVSGIVSDSGVGSTVAGSGTGGLFSGGSSGPQSNLLNPGADKTAAGVNTFGSDVTGNQGMGTMGSGSILDASSIDTPAGRPEAAISSVPRVAAGMSEPIRSGVLTSVNDVGVGSSTDGSFSSGASSGPESNLLTHGADKITAGMNMGSVDSGIAPSGDPIGMGNADVRMIPSGGPNDISNVDGGFASGFDQSLPTSGMIPSGIDQGTGQVGGDMSLSGAATSDSAMGGFDSTNVVGVDPSLIGSDIPSQAGGTRAVYDGQGPDIVGTGTGVVDSGSEMIGSGPGFVATDTGIVGPSPDSSSVDTGAGMNNVGEASLLIPSIRTSNTADGMGMGSSGGAGDVVTGTSSSAFTGPESAMNFEGGAPGIPNIDGGVVSPGASIDTSRVNEVITSSRFDQSQPTVSSAITPADNYPDTAGSDVASTGVGQGFADGNTGMSGVSTGSGPVIPIGDPAMTGFDSSFTEPAPGSVISGGDPGMAEPSTVNLPDLSAGPNQGSFIDLSGGGTGQDVGIQDSSIVDSRTGVIDSSSGMIDSSTGMVAADTGIVVPSSDPSYVDSGASLINELGDAGTLIPNVGTSGFGSDVGASVSTSDIGNVGNPSGGDPSTTGIDSGFGLTGGPTDPGIVDSGPGLSGFDGSSLPGIDSAGNTQNQREILTDSGPSVVDSGPGITEFGSGTIDPGMVGSDSGSATSNVGIIYPDAGVVSTGQNIGDPGAGIINDGGATNMLIPSVGGPSSSVGSDMTGSVGTGDVGSIGGGTSSDSVTGSASINVGDQRTGRTQGDITSSRFDQSMRTVDSGTIPSGVDQGMGTVGSDMTSARIDLGLGDPMSTISLDQSGSGSVIPTGNIDMGRFDSSMTGPGSVTAGGESGITGTVIGTDLPGGNTATLVTDPGMVESGPGVSGSDGISAGLPNLPSSIADIPGLSSFESSPGIVDSGLGVVGTDPGLGLFDPNLNMIDAGSSDPGVNIAGGDTNMLNPSVAASPETVAPDTGMTGSDPRFASIDSGLISSGPELGVSGPGMVDSGPSMVDTGPGMVDSGPGMVDSGPGMVDSGPGMVDSGLGMVDSGLGMVDSGPGMVDSRPGMVESNAGIVNVDPGFIDPNTGIVDPGTTRVDSSPGYEGPSLETINTGSSIGDQGTGITRPEVDTNLLIPSVGSSGTIVGSDIGGSGSTSDVVDISRSVVDINPLPAGGTGSMVQPGDLPSVGGARQRTFTIQEIQNMITGMENNKKQYNYDGVEASQGQDIFTLPYLRSELQRLQGIAGPSVPSQFSIQRLQDMIQGMKRDKIVYNYEGVKAGRGQQTLSLQYLEEQLRRQQQAAGSSVPSQFSIQKLQDMIQGMKRDKIVYNFEGVKAAQGQQTLSLQYLEEQLRRQQQAAGPSVPLQFSIQRLQDMIQGMKRDKIVYNYEGVKAGRGQQTLSLQYLEEQLRRQQQAAGPSVPLQFSIQRLQDMIQGMKRDKIVYNYEGVKAGRGQQTLSLQYLEEQLRRQQQAAGPSVPLQFSIQRLQDMIQGMKRDKIVYNYEGVQAAQGQQTLSLQYLEEQLRRQQQAAGPSVPLQFSIQRLQDMIQGMQRDKIVYNYEGVQAAQGQQTLSLQYLEEQLRRQQQAEEYTSPATFTMAEIENMIYGMNNNNKRYNYRGLEAGLGQKTISLTYLQNELRRLRGPPPKVPAIFTIQEIEDMIAGMKTNKKFYNYQGYEALPGDQRLELIYLQNRLQRLKQLVGAPPSTGMTPPRDIDNTIVSCPLEQIRKQIRPQTCKCHRILLMHNSNLFTEVGRRMMPRFTIDQVKNMIFGIRNNNMVYNEEGVEAAKGEKQLTLQYLERLLERLNAIARPAWMQAKLDPAPCRLNNCTTEICYVPYKNDCKSYIVCQRTALGTYVAWKMRCAFGSYWGTGKLWTCERVEDLVDMGYRCPNDKCRNSTSLSTYPDEEEKNCRTYWRCENGLSKPACCPPGQMFDRNTLRCENDPDERCRSPCPLRIEGCAKPNAKTQPFYDGNCRTYWDCEKGKPHPVCCPAGHSYNTRDGSCIRDNSCGHHCPRQYAENVCGKLIGKSRVTSYGLDDDNCRTFMKCFGRDWGEPACCRQKHFYNVTSAQCEPIWDYLDLCNLKLCPIGYKQDCRFKAVLGNKKLFYDSDAKLERACAPGTEFDEDICTCNTYVTYKPVKRCKKEIDVRFDDPKKRWSAKNHGDGFVSIYGTMLKNKTTTGTYFGTFNGRGGMQVWRYDHTKLKEVTLKITFQPMSVDRARQILVSNCRSVDGYGPSFEVSLDLPTSRVVFRGQTDNGTAVVAVSYDPANWNTYTLLFDGENVVAMIEDPATGQEDTSSAALNGQILAGIGSLKFGPCTDSANVAMDNGFVGYMSEVTFSKCLGRAGKKRITKIMKQQQRG